MIPLQHGNLVPGEDTYPNTPQVLLQRFASNLFVPELPQQFYSHNSPDQVPVGAVWFDTSDKALKTYDSGWRPVLAGNTAFRVYANNGAIAANTNIFSKNAAPTGNRGQEICTLTFVPRVSGNRVVVTAHVPAVTTTENDITVFGMLTAGNSPFGVSTVSCRAGVLNGLFITSIHTPAASDV